ncbi:MAG: hypothetical protein KJ771_00770 [Nanoarchaeota archaeon]|nr:hypothetical protein [Nanoarchaeota archaeon]
MTYEINRFKIKYSDETKDKFEDVSEQLELPETIIETFDYIINKTNQELLDFYTPPLNEKKYYEVFMSQALHMELLLRKLISLKLNIPINDFYKNSFYDLINIAFENDLIYDDQAIEFHKIRVMRNKLAHNFLHHFEFNFADIVDTFGKNTIKILELQDRINKK